jgi:hypothetical protein
MLCGRRWASVGIMVLYGVLSASNIYAWGDIGHQIVCEICQPDYDSS